MKRLSKLLFVLIPGALLVAGTVTAGPPDFAGPPGHHGKKDKHRHYHDRGRGYKGGGPPPWAPAHGYRRKHDRGHNHGYVSAPVNIEVGRCNREIIGRVLGGATGGLVGSQIGDGTGRLIAVATGTVVGMVIGGEIGRSMDEVDRLCVDQALEHAPDGKTIQWHDEERQYNVTPRETRQDDNGRYCREYQMESEVGGRAEQVYGRACRQPDGSWQIVS